MTVPDPTTWLDNYGDMLFRYALVRVRDKSAAEDLVQETLLAALKQKVSFRAESSESTWLIGILKHKIIDYIRRLYRDQPQSDAEILSSNDDRGFRPDGEWARGFFPSDWGFDPHGLLEREEFWCAFDHCLSLLPKRMASIFALYVVDEVPSGDLCNDFNISPTNLRVVLYRSRKQLRECLDMNWFQKGTDQ